MKRLLGLENELSYVTDGRVNKYAMGFVIPVPSTVSALHFTWRSGSASSPSYMISASSSHPTALPTPTLNITKEGTVPAEPQVWRRFLPTFIQHFSSSIQLVPQSTGVPFNSSLFQLVLSLGVAALPPVLRRRGCRGDLHSQHNPGQSFSRSD